MLGSKDVDLRWQSWIMRDGVSNYSHKITAMTGAISQIGLVLWRIDSLARSLGIHDCGVS